MRLALVLCAVVLLGIAPSWYASPVSASVGNASSTAPAAHGGNLNLDIPSHFFRNGGGSCTGNGNAERPAISPINLPAAGTGASATWNPETFAPNTAVNTTLIVPTGSLSGSSSSAQYEIMGIGDPWNSTAFMAAGMAKAYVSQLSTTYALPVAYLPNGTAIINEDIFDLTTLTDGATYYFNITHVHGNWWSFTENGHAIEGGTTTGGVPSPAWENGTYNLGAKTASGTLCEEGGTVGPSFIAATYATNTTLPTLPKTYVPWAVGVESSGGSSTNYVAAAANAMPQFNSTLGTIGIEGHAQLSSIRIDSIYVGTPGTNGVSFPGAFVSIWGNYRVEILNQSSLSPVAPTLAYSGSQVFTATALNQTGVTIPGATYNWSSSPAALGTLTPSGTTATLKAGSTTIDGKVWANVSYNCSHISNVATVVVTPTGGPSITSFTATNYTLVVGGTVPQTTLTVTNATWGSLISYQWTGLPFPCGSSNHSKITCVPTTPGNYSVRVFLNSSGHSSNATLSHPLVVWPALKATAFAATPNPVSYNTSVRFVVNTTGGEPSLTYNYSGLPRGCTNGTSGSPILGCIPLQVGTFTVLVTVTDAAGNIVTDSTTIKVNQAVALTAFTATPNTIYVGQTTYLNVTRSGGTAPFTFSYRGLPTGCKSQNLTSITCIPSENGTFIIYANVTDHTGSNATLSTVLTVNTPPTPVITNLVATPNPVNVTKTTKINVTATGGTGPLTYTYTGLPPGCTSSNTSSLPCTPNKAGNFSIRVFVNDSAKNSVNQVLVLQVTSLPGAPPTISSFHVPSPIQAGQSTYLSVNASGGTGTLSYAYVGLPPGCTSANTDQLSCTPTRAGNYTITVYVNDSAAHSAQSTQPMQVTPAPCTTCGKTNNTGSAGGLTTTDYVLIVVVVVAAVGAVVGLLVMKKRKGGPPPVAPYQAPPPQNAPPVASAPPPGRQTPSWPPRQ